MGSADSSPITQHLKSDRRKSHYYAVPPLPPNMAKRHGSNDDKFVYKGRVDLAIVDLEVVVGSALEDTRRFEVLSPEGSFFVYAGEPTFLILAYLKLMAIQQQKRKETAGLRKSEEPRLNYLSH